MTDKTYNGWTNYATWRVNLEMFDGANWDDYYIGSFPEPYDLGLALKEHVNDYVYGLCDDRHRLIEGWISAFLSDVNWYEIAQHMLEDCQEEIKE